LNRKAFGLRHQANRTISERPHCSIVRTLSNHDRSGSRSLLDKTDDEQIAREIDHKSIMLKAGLRLGLTPQQIGTI
jgi:hypothetical protein